MADEPLSPQQALDIIRGLRSKFARPLERAEDAIIAAVEADGRLRAFTAQIAGAQQQLMTLEDQRVKAEERTRAAEGRAQDAERAGAHRTQVALAQAGDAERKAAEAITTLTAEVQARREHLEGELTNRLTDLERAVTEAERKLAVAIEARDEILRRLGG